MSEQSKQETQRSEVESHPADPHFNPAHPDHVAWSSGPKPPDMPAEAGIVAMFTDPAGPISDRDVTVQEPVTPESESQSPDGERREEPPAETTPTDGDEQKPTTTRKR